jgi:hypothetical protein
MQQKYYFKKHSFMSGLQEVQQSAGEIKQQQSKTPPVKEAAGLWPLSVMKEKLDRQFILTCLTVQFLRTADKGRILIFVSLFKEVVRRSGFIILNDKINF